MQLFKLAIISLVLLTGVPAALAEDQPQPQATEPSVADKREQELSAAADAAQKAAIAGPKDIPVAKQATLALPAGYVFIPQPDAGNLAHALGNGRSPSLIGLITAGENGDWLAYLDYLDDGYVKDDDAKTWDADALLQSLKDGTEISNEDRKSRGFPEIEIAGWVEKPAYDAAQHRLVWSALVARKGVSGAEGSVNYNTYALGRSGHFELNLVTSADKIEGHKADAKTLLAALNFDDGKRYQDFDAKSDKVAAYGLAALIGGVAAKKLGLLALAAGLFAKFFKLIAVVAIAGLGGIKRLFSRQPRA